MTNYEIVQVDDYEYIKKTNEDGTFTHIPKDPSNSDYQRYLRWLKNPDTDEEQFL